jgi:hypothetical protein
VHVLNFLPYYVQAFLLSGAKSFGQLRSDSVSQIFDGSLVSTFFSREVTRYVPIFTRHFHMVYLRGQLKPDNCIYGKISEQF